MKTSRAVSLAMIIMALSNLLSRILGFVRIQVLAGIGGTSSAMDAYVFSFAVPDLINHLLAGSALSITFIPLFQKRLTSENPQKAWDTLNNILTIGSIGFGISIVGAMIFTPALLSLAGDNIADPSQPDQFALTVFLTRIILPAQIFFFWGALLNGVQYAHKKFLIPALTPLIYNAGIIGAGILLYRYMGMAAFSWGVSGGAFVGAGLIQWIGARKCGLRYRFRFDLTDPDLHRYVLTTLPLMLGLGMTFSNELLFRFFGSYIPDGNGALASLDFSYKLMFLMVGLLGQAPAAGLYPFISQFIVEKKFDEASRLVHRVLTRINALIMPASATLLVVAPHVVAFLLQRGAFDENSTAMTAAALRWYLPGAAACASLLVVNRLFFAGGNTLTPMIVSTLTVCALLPVYWLVARTRGATGIAMVTSFSLCVQCAVSYAIWTVKHRSGETRSLLYSLSITVGVSLLGGLLMWFGKEWLTAGGWLTSLPVFLYNLVVSAVVAIPGMALMIGVLSMTGQISVSELRSLMRRRS